MIDAMNNSDVAAFCIMDYWHFDGWFALQEYLTRNVGALKKNVFPGIEIRLEAPTDFKLNTHFLFDDIISKQQLVDFLATLKIGSVVQRSISPFAFAELGRSYGDDKLQEHGYSPADKANEDKMLELGMKTAKITRESWKQAKAQLGDKALIIQPYDTNDGLEDLNWHSHPYDDVEIMQLADFFETRKKIHVDLFIGKGHPTRPDITNSFFQALGKKWRPVLSGSDAHRFSDYGKYPSNKICWLKADISFAGLRQCMVDPLGRVFIGGEPEKMRHQNNNKTKYISSLEIRKSRTSTLTEKWFDTKLYINPGMIAVIGNKGSGKSALADIIALAGNSHSTNFEFLNQQRFRKGSNNRAAQFEAKLIWSDGNDNTVFLSDEPKADSPERVRYLLQQYIEDICTDISKNGASAFEKELKKVVFSHVPTHQRLGQDTLDKIIDYQTHQLERRANDIRSELSDVNKKIANYEFSASVENIASINAVILLKTEELAALDVKQLQVPEKPLQQGEDNIALSLTINAINEQILQETRALTELQSAQTQNSAALNATTRLFQGVRNIIASIERALPELIEDAKICGLEVPSIITYSLNADIITKRQKELEAERLTISNSIDNTQIAITQLSREFETLQSQASEPERLYQAALKEFTAWEERRNLIIGDAITPDTLRYWQFQLDYLSGEGKANLEELYAKRIDLAKEIYGQLQLQVDLYKNLYEPVAVVAASHNFVRDNMQLGFNALIEGNAFQEHLLSMLNLNKRGSFYQTEGAKTAKKLVQEADFSSWDGVKLFLDSVINALTLDQREGRGDSVSISSQLRDTFKVEELYDNIFGLGYLKPRLTLQLAGKEVGELSPGERGILLLVFYLLLDQEEIPLIIDQPEHNLDNSSVYKLLEPCIRHAKEHRQILLVTHNPNVAIVCDAEQIISASIDKVDGNKIVYRSGAIENSAMNMSIVDVLEGTWPAFNMRDETYQRLVF
jgi:ABC-type lipoprotein export system ATPase subunit